MAKNTLLVAGPKLQKKLRDLSNDVTNVDLTTSIKTSKKQEIISSSKKNAVYDGFFAVQFDGKTFSVVDGSDRNSKTAGYCWVNGEARSVDIERNIQPKNGFLCIKATYNSENCTFEIVDNFPSKPEAISKPDYYPLAKIELQNKQWTFRQITKWVIPQLWIFADCEDEAQEE